MLLSSFPEQCFGDHASCLLEQVVLKKLLADRRLKPTDRPLEALLIMSTCLPPSTVTIVEAYTPIPAGYADVSCLRGKRAEVESASSLPAYSSGWTAERICAAVDVTEKKQIDKVKEELVGTVLEKAFELRGCSVDDGEDKLRELDQQIEQKSDILSQKKDELKD